MSFVQMSEKLLYVASQKGLSRQCIVLVGIEVEVCNRCLVVKIYQRLDGSVTTKISVSLSCSQTSLTLGKSYRSLL